MNEIKTKEDYLRLTGTRDGDEEAALIDLRIMRALWIYAKDHQDDANRIMLERTAERLSNITRTRIGFDMEGGALYSVGRGRVYVLKMEDVETITATLNDSK